MKFGCPNDENRKQTQTAFTQSCYDALVMSKAFLLESARSMYDVIKTKGTAEDMNLYAVLASMKNQVKAWERDYKVNADTCFRHFLGDKKLIA